MKIELEVTRGPHKGRKFSFGAHDMFLVGRSADAHFRLSEDDQFFSRMHFMIEVNPPRCRLTDLDSTNGTFVNGKPVSAVDLGNGDVITGGTTTINVTIHALEETADFENLYGETQDELDAWIPSGLNDGETTSPKATRESQIDLDENDLSNSFAIPDGSAPPANPAPPASRSRTPASSAASSAAPVKTLPGARISTSTAMRSSTNWARGRWGTSGSPPDFRTPARSRSRRFGPAARRRPTT